MTRSELAEIRRPIIEEALWWRNEHRKRKGELFTRSYCRGIVKMALFSLRAIRGNA